MIRGTFFGLEIGKTGLKTAQFGLDVTGHNISNLDTAGYTRQRIVQEAYDPFAAVGRFAPIGQGLVGGGVRVQILDQIRSAYLDKRFREESTMNSYWDTRAQSLTYIESFFDNVNEKTSINFSIAEFFRSMTLERADPVAGAPRTLMQTSAMDLVQQLNMIYDGLIDFQKVENRAVETKTEDINRIARDIAELNVAVYTFELTGMLANDLRDKRNLLIDELSRYVDIEYSEFPDQYGHGMMEIRIMGQPEGDYLVRHDETMTLGIAKIPNPLEGGEPLAVPYWLHLAAAGFDPDNPDPDELDDARLDFSRIRGGELRAHVDMRDGEVGGIDSRTKGIPYYIEMMNNLARALVQEINGQHVQGWTDHPSGSRTGIHFFSVLDADGNPVEVGTIEYLDAAGDPLVPQPTAPVDPSIPKRYVLTDDDLRSITAKNITLSQDIRDSAYNIAASSVEIIRGSAGGDPEDQQRGNNENMIKLYRLFSETGITVLGQPVGSFDEFATTIRFDVGSNLRTAKNSAETSGILSLAANNQRTAIAGVSLDEEMVGLVRYNHAYNGAARVITAMDDLLDRLINGTGRVGL